MYGNLERDEAARYPQGAELPEGSRMGQEQEDGQPGIGARIVAIPAEMNRPLMIQQPAPGQGTEAPPPGLQRLVDVQRQQQLLGELTRTWSRPPVLRQTTANGGGQGISIAVAPPASRSSAVKSNGVERPEPGPNNARTWGKPTLSTASPHSSGKAAPQRGRGVPASAAAKASSAQQGASGSKAPSKPGFLDRAKSYVHDVEQNVEDTVSAGWHNLWGDKQDNTRRAGQSTPQSPQGGQKPLTTEQLDEASKANEKASQGERGPRWKGPARPVSEGGNILKAAPGKSLIESYQNFSYRNDKNNTECVTFIQQATGAPVTKTWKQGQKIRKGDHSVPVGTVIATFVDGHYSTLGRSNQHAAVYLGQDEQGIWVLNQHNGTKKVVVERIPWMPRSSGLSNDGKAFSVVKW
jgi:hypothetical protein